MTVDSILGEHGLISRRLEHYEPRPQQLRMAHAVADAIAEKRHLIVEAGTGVGKSFAYLVPAILAIADRQRGEDADSRLRVVISTHTISLQEQLVRRDIPFLNAVMPIEFSSVLVKGRGNYVSIRRLNKALERANSLFADPEDLDQLDRIAQWARSTTDGSLSDLPFRPRPHIWDEIQSDRNNCLGRKCPTYQACFYHAARRRIWNADLLVVNHALFFSDLALRREGSSILPEYNVVVFDEAHTLEAVAADHLGLSVTSGQIEYQLNKLYNPRTQRGLLLHYQLGKQQQLVSEARAAADEFFDQLNGWFERKCPANGRVRTPPELDDQLTPAMKNLARSLMKSVNCVDKDEDKIELSSAAERCAALAASIDAWLKQNLENHVYWIERSDGRRLRIRMVSAPIDVGPTLRDELFNQTDTVILTSATLAVGENNFQFFKSRIGLTDAQELQLGSPFDYRRQVRLIVTQNMPDPGEQPEQFEAKVCEKLKKYLAQTQGRAFVLFTSYRMMRNCAAQLTPWLAENRLTLFCQGENLERSAMLERFQQTPGAVLFGTDSFWHGVDVPGQALSNVIIVKLPFSVPDHPLLEARLEAIRLHGGNPFMQYQLPEAIIKLKQGFGRLIRRKTDTGQVVILDPRVLTKRYGRLFLESLPPCDLVIDTQ